MSFFDVAVSDIFAVIVVLDVAVAAVAGFVIAVAVGNRGGCCNDSCRLMIICGDC